MSGMRALLGIVCASVLAGCDLLDPSGPEVSVSLSLTRASVVAPTLHAQVGAQRVQVSAPTGSAPRSELQIRGTKYGSVPVRVELLSADGDTLAAVQFMHEFERDHGHWITGLVGSWRPIGHCIGTLIVEPLRSGAGDTLFLTHGRFPKGDAVC